MWAASEDAVTDTQMELLPSFLGLAEGWGERQCVTIYRAGLGTQMDLYMLPSLLERPIEWVRRECMHSSIIKASVGCKQAVKDTVTDTETDHFIIIAVLCIF